MSHQTIRNKQDTWKIEYKDTQNIKDNQDAALE